MLMHDLFAVADLLVRWLLYCFALHTFVLVVVEILQSKVQQQLSTQQQLAASVAPKS